MACISAITLIGHTPNSFPLLFIIEEIVYDEPPDHP